jgi:tetratricopeptide (TPR) repeat protein
MAAQALQTAERRLQELAFPVPQVAHALDEAKRGFAAADYVKALDAVVKAADALADIRGELGEVHKARDRVQSLLSTVQEVGAETVKLIQIFDEGEAAMHVGDVTKARGAYGQATEWATGVLKNYLRDRLARASAVTDKCRRLQIDPTSALNHLAEARTRIEAGDFMIAFREIEAGQAVAQAALGSRLNEAILKAADNVTHAKKLGTDAREAEDILNQARARIERMEYDGALELTERALEKVESVKVVERRFVDLTYKAESTIRNGKKFGIDMRQAEKRLGDSMGLRKSNLADAIKAAEEAYRIAWDAVEEFAPSIQVRLEMGPTRLNEWTDATLTLENVGKGLAKDVQVKVLGDAETEGLQALPAVRAKGQEALTIRVKMTASGSVPLAIQVTSHRVFDDKAYTQEMIAQVDVAEDAIERPRQLVADLETRCPICKGMIKKGFKVLRCGCGRDFHELCASRIGRCPACFRPLGLAAG